MNLTIITPEKELLKAAQIEEVIVPGITGELGILKGHAPLITTLSSGVLKYKLATTNVFQEVALSWGYCEVRADHHVVVLAESADTKKQIDKDITQKKLEDILKKLEDISLSPEKIRKLRKEEAEKKALLQLYN